MIRRCAIAVVLLAVSLGATAAGGQTTQPAGAPWPKLVKALAQALISADRSALDTLVDDRVLICRFDGTIAEPSIRLKERAAKATLVGAHGYMHPPLVMAADIAADFKNCPSIPDEVKRHMIPEDDAEMQRANATAVQWVTEMLQITTNQPVGVIVLWCAPSASGAATGTSDQPQTVFLLIKGQETAPDQFRLRQIVYGHPQQNRN